MTVRLVILGLLRERPLYGYEIKQIIEEHMSDWTSIAFGSIYFALDKLAEEKFVEKVEVEQEGKRPSRSVYQITSTGREEFLACCAKAGSSLSGSIFHWIFACSFWIACRLKRSRNTCRSASPPCKPRSNMFRSHRTEQLAIPEIPPLAAAIFDHTLVHTRAELDWVTDLLQKLESGKVR